MEYINYVIIGILIYIIGSRFMPANGIRNISTLELKSELKDKNKLFIDVRTPGEYKRTHIKEFKNIPLNLLAQKAEKELPKDKEIIVICQSGMRSVQASKILKKFGYTKVTNVKGGMNAWSL
ncbi:rhodanese-like domain-containing protein [Neobacillus niacini]|uniref:rhodanese-like domain-containing protein n=1 Tax=Neobacillus niacini TaxID=86668 RepID=UPI003982F843